MSSSDAPMVSIIIISPSHLRFLLRLYGDRRANEDNLGEGIGSINGDLHGRSHSRADAVENGCMDGDNDKVVRIRYLLQPSPSSKDPLSYRIFKMATKAERD